MTMLWWVVESSVRLTLLAGLAAAAMWALRVKSAETQLRVWTGVIVASFVLPFLPDQWTLPVNFGIAEPTATSALIAGSGATAAIRDNAVSGLLSRPDPETLLLTVYLAGVAALLANVALGWSWARRLTAEAAPVTDQMFLESPLVHVPVTAGLLRPRVIVPHTWREWPADVLTAVRAHEGAHAARRDGLWLTIALCHRAVQWFNPLSWWLARHLASLSERASDDAALIRGVSPVRYAEIVLSFASVVSTHHRRVAWIVAMARPSGRDTERRLDRVLTWKGRAEMNRSRIVVLALVLLSGSAAVYTAGVTPQAPPLPQAVGESSKTSPVVLQRVDPMYTPDARRAGIQGIVEMQIEIDTAGAVAEAKVIKSLDSTFGLDEESLKTVRLWRFRPATINGKPTQVTAVVQMEFRLHDEPRARRKAEPNVAPKAAPAEVQKAGPVIVQPVVTKRVDPKYTPEAMRQKIQGLVTLLVVVDAKGVVKSATVAESLDSEHGLDTNAVDAVMQWTFLPGTIDGEPKPFTVKVTMEFRLH